MSLIIKSRKSLPNVSKLYHFHNSLVVFNAPLSTQAFHNSPAPAPPPPFPITSVSSPLPPLTNPSPPQPLPTSLPHPQPQPLRYPWLPGRLPASFGRNQVVKVSDELLKDLEQVVSSFKAPIRYAFAYGSGVFRQSGYSDTEKPMLDFIFAVSHPEHWHAINLHHNPSHYAVPMRWFGSGAITLAQERLGAGVWFNVNVEIGGKKLKYGVVSVDTLRNDLLDWDTLYLAGRMHKPIKILREDPRIRLDQQVNLANSFRTSLLLLPESFTEQQLYETIAGLSYRGDFRMAVGENPNKVRNIVSNQLDQFRQLYGGFISAGFRHHISFQSGPSTSQVGSPPRLLIQDKNPRMRAELARKLPLGLRDKIWTRYQQIWHLEKKVEKDLTDEERINQNLIWQRITSDSGFSQVVDDSIQSIIRRPAFKQSIKGVLTAGPAKTFSYILPKLKKRWNSTPPSIDAPAK